MRLTQQTESVVQKKSNELLAEANDMQGFYEHLYETLLAIEFLDGDNPRKMMNRLRRLFNRAQPNKIEINVLRGILSAIQKKSRQ